jgi:ATP-dependent helicase/nuclease subunit B
MATIAPANPDTTHADPWTGLARRVVDWATRHELPLRDLVLLVPFLQLLAPARRAFAALGTWLPRIETTRTLAASLGPPEEPGSGELGWGIAQDNLLAVQTLAQRPWGAEWSRRDPRGFARGAARVVATARQLLMAAAAVPPDERDDWWRLARETLHASGGPGSRERLLAQVALEWAARSGAPDSDRLFSLRPAAWVVAVAGGSDPLAMSLLRRAAVPTLVIDTDAALDDLFHGVACDPAPTFAVCDGFEDEAAAAAAQAILHVERGEAPVALIAQDRVLVRRIRALLERKGIVLCDETGWKLATTRAGASIMSLLAAARHDAPADTWLDWLKSAPLGSAREAALATIEAALRRAQMADAEALPRLALAGAASDLRSAATAILDTFAGRSRRGLVEWLEALAAALEGAGSLARLRDDAAGRQALAALGLEPGLAPSRRQQIANDLEPMTLADFTSWVDDLLEGATFLPPDPLAADGTAMRAEVVVTPLARAMLRPFAAVVLPGADDRRLGAMAPADSLLPRPALQALGMADAQVVRDAELLAFAQALRLPRVTLLRRRSDDGDPLGDSPFVERLRLALGERGADLSTWRDPRPDQVVAPTPIVPGAPAVAATRLPTQLSASTFEALRDCPYRFFSRSVLGLREAEELDPELEKRDYGKWLHDVLHTFHREREAAAASVAGDTACLLAVGAASRIAGGLDEAAFLPFTASFEVLAPRYVEWLHARERAGAAWADGEIELHAAPPELGGVELAGRIDRIDRVDGGRRLELIDYKTGSSSGLKAKVRERYEDTQLAFYAALVGARSALPLRAFYLALDATHGLESHEHPDVAESAAMLVAGVADDLRRLREGAGLPPLGEGSACEYCEARGLCRRDHWTRAPASAPQTGPA